MTDVDVKFREIIERREGKPAIEAAWQVFIPEPRSWRDPTSWFGGHVVSRPNRERGIVTGSIAIRLHAPEQEWRLTVDVCYEACVSREERDPHVVAAKVVAALGATERPGTTFESRLEEMIQRCVKEQGGPSSVLPRLAAFRSVLKAEIRKRMSLELGLDVVLTSVAPAGGITKPESHAFTRDVRFHAADYSAVELTAQVQLELETAGSLAYVHQDDFEALQDQLVARARDYLQRKKLQELDTELGAIERDIRVQLDPLASRRGRRITRFALVYASIVDHATQSVRIAPFLVPFDKGVDYPRAVTVQCEMHLTRRDAGAYVRAGQPSLQTWAESACRIAVEETLLNVSYVDLFLGREPKGETGFVRYDLRIEQTKRAIRDRVLEIGYVADTVTLRTDLDFVGLRDGFRIALTGESFPMADPLHVAELDVDVRARIHTEAAIRALFDRGTNILDELQTRVRETVQAVMKETKPDVYYIYFADETHRESAGQNVLTGLRDRIRSMLKERYEADRITIACTPRTTIYEERFRALSQGDHALTIVAEQVNLTYDFTYRVKLISRIHWREFRDRLPTLEQVQALTTASLAQWMNDQPRDRLRQTTNQTLRNLLNEPETGVFAAVVHELGLMVQVMTVQRGLDKEGEAALELVSDGRIQAAYDLEHQRKERITSLDRRIARLRQLAEDAERMSEHEEACDHDRRANELAAEREQERTRSIYIGATKAIEIAAAASGGDLSRVDWALNAPGGKPRVHLDPEKK